jgi:hypothetical protein
MEITMPLKTTPKDATKSEKQKTLSENIKIERDAGKPPKQAIAIAFAKARERKKD